MICGLSKTLALASIIDMPKRSFEDVVEQKLGKFLHFWIFAILEWVLIILLFMDGLLAFISNEFANFFGLKTPCLLCTRIDHVFVRRNSTFYYNDAICEVHKKDISSLAFCQMHKKLSDIRSMCQGCLLPYATEKDSDTESYKPLVGILHKDVDAFVEDDKKLLLNPLKNDEAELSDEKNGIPRCSCCGEPLKLKYVRALPTNTPAPSRCVSLKEGLNVELPHIRYTELRITSDTDSEIPEEDELNIDNQGREVAKASTLPLLPDAEDIREDLLRTPRTPRTPLMARGNRFFGIPFDSGQMSPRWGANNRAIRRPSIDRIDFNMEPTEVNEVDGVILSRLKRQVRLDRKSLMDLYMELDEERSASAVAANNAMAMITRLQAEKAAVQMEALQYQRMMEEQAEYDEEALQVMRDMLLKREEDVKTLETELEAYKEKYGPIKQVGSDTCEVDDEDYQEMKTRSTPSPSGTSDCGSLDAATDQNVENQQGNEETSSLDFNGERYYLLGLLTDIQRNMSAEEGFSSSEPCSVMNEDEGNETKNKGMLTREVSLIKERLRTVEAESGFLKHAAMTLQKGGEGTKLLNEIAQHLRELRRTAKSPPDEMK